MSARAMAAVEKGGALLTRHFGETDWKNVLDPEILWVEDPTRCPLGQLFGYYDNGAGTLGLDQVGAGAHGFDFTFDYGYDQLDEAWREYLARV